MSRRLRAFLWLGRFLPLHGPVTICSGVGFTVPTDLGALVALVLGLNTRITDWSV
jgi:hypothetical protein